MTILTMPSSPGFQSSEFGLEYNTKVFSSQLSFSTQTAVYPGSRWMAQYKLPPMRPEKAAPWLAFLNQLEGEAGQFYGYNPDLISLQGGASGSITVNGADQTGKVLNVVGVAADLVDAFKAGDMIAYDAGSGRSLHMVTANVDANSSGEVAIPIVPAIRVSPSDGEALIIDKASCVMRLTEPSVRWSSDSNSIANIQFNAIEVYL